MGAYDIESEDILNNNQNARTDPNDPNDDMTDADGRARVDPVTTESNENGKMPSFIIFIIIGLILILILGLSYYFLNRNTLRSQMFGSRNGFVDNAFLMFGKS